MQQTITIQNLCGHKRMCGEINEKNEYITHRTEAHYFRIFEGFGISVRVLDALIANGVPRILLFYHHNIASEGIGIINITELYIVAPQVWKEKGHDWVWQGKEQNRINPAYDEQLILPLGYFEKR